MSNLLSQASLVMIPSGYKEDIVYSPVPTNGNGDLSFTRASNGTRINSAGLVEVCPWNLATNSENFTLWNLANVTVTANDLTAPNGTLTADKLTISNNANDVKQTISVMPNSVYTWTFYVYGGTALGQQGRFYDNTNGANIEYYSYSSSVVLGQWVKIERTFTTPSGCYEIQAWVLAATSTIGTMWAWGAQLNIGSTAKPYFPTTDRLNVPRLTYQNGGGGCPSLLLEKQSTNDLSYSEEFDNSAWSVKDNLSVTANVTTSPDGTQNADKLVENSSNDQHRIYRSADGTNKMFSFFAKASERSWVSVLCNNGNFTWFDLANGQVGTVAATSTATIENVGNGWYRCAVYNTHGSFGSLIQIATANNVTSYQGNGTSGIFVWGAQLEASSYATSYIPTTSSSATRVADACYKTGISSLFGTNQGTFFIDLLYLNSVTPDYLFDVTDSSNTNRFLMYDSDGTGLFAFYDTGYSVVDVYQFTKGQRYKIAVKYNSSGTIWYVNGTLRATGTVSFAHQMSQIYIGQRFSISNQSQIQVNETIVFPTALSGTELISLTTI